MTVDLLTRTASRCRRAYILPLWFFSFFLIFTTPNLWGHWTDLNHQIGHIFNYDCYLKNLVQTPPGIYHPHGLGAKARFWGPTLNFDETYLCKETWYTPLQPPNVVNFGPETAENGWPVFAHPLNFRIGKHCQPYRMDVIITDSRQTLARVM